MKRLYKTITLAAMLLAMPLAARSQEDTIVSHSGDIAVGNAPTSVRPMHPLGDTGRLLDDDSLRRWQFHLSMGTGIVGSRHATSPYFTITPSLTFQPSDRLKINASVTMLDSYSMYPGGYNIRGREVRNLAPVRNYSAAAAALSVSATYRASDRLWVAASLFHTSGGLASAALVNPWFPADMPLMLDATAFSAAMRYRIGESSFLDIHLTVIDDRTGAFTPMLFGTPFGGYYGDYIFSPFYGHTTSLNVLMH